MYNTICVTEITTRKQKTGCGSAWLERLVWDQEVAGSNPVTPTYANNEQSPCLHETMASVAITSKIRKAFSLV